MFNNICLGFQKCVFYTDSSTRVLKNKYQKVLARKESNHTCARDLTRLLPPDVTIQRERTFYLFEGGDTYKKISMEVQMIAW